MFVGNFFDFDKVEDVQIRICGRFGKNEAGVFAD